MHHGNMHWPSPYFVSHHLKDSIDTVLFASHCTGKTYQPGGTGKYWFDIKHGAYLSSYLGYATGAVNVTDGFQLENKGSSFPDLLSYFHYFSQVLPRLGGPSCC
jgi:hypothetical protein